MRRVKRVAAMLRSGNAASANKREPGTLQHEHDATASIVNTLAIVSGISSTTQVDLLDVGVRVRHQLTGLRVVVEREVQTLQVRDEPHAQVGLDADTRGGTRRTAAGRCRSPGPPQREDDPRPLERDVEISRDDAFVDRLTGQPGIATRAAVQTNPARIPSQTHMRSGCTASRMSRQPASSRFAFVVQNAPGSPADRRLPAPT